MAGLWVTLGCAIMTMTADSSLRVRHCAKWSHMLCGYPDNDTVKEACGTPSDCFTFYRGSQHVQSQVHSKGQKWNPLHASKCCWRLCYSQVAELSDFYLAAKRLSQTRLGHLWEPSVPSWWCKLIHLDKWLLKSFGCHWYFCLFKFLLIVIKINFMSSNQENSSSPFRWGGLKHCFYADLEKGKFPGSLYIKLGHNCLNSLGFSLFIIVFLSRWHFIKQEKCFLQWLRLLTDFLNSSFTE